MPMDKETQDLIDSLTDRIRELEEKFNKSNEYRIRKLEKMMKEREKIGYNYLDKDLQARILTLVQLTDLTDGGATTLHSH
jgi:hypothetical protein